MINNDLKSKFNKLSPIAARDKLTKDANQKQIDEKYVYLSDEKLKLKEQVANNIISTQYLIDNFKHVKNDTVIDF